jgi:hypothetical protein
LKIIVKKNMLKRGVLAMVKFNTLIKFKDNTVMYQRDSNAAFTNAKLKGLNKPADVMYMYSKDNKDFFKNIMDRKYISFNQ